MDANINQKYNINKEKVYKIKLFFKELSLYCSYRIFIDPKLIHLHRRYRESHLVGLCTFHKFLRSKCLL